MHLSNTHYRIGGFPEMNLSVRSIRSRHHLGSIDLLCAVKYEFLSARRPQNHARTPFLSRDAIEHSFRHGGDDKAEEDTKGNGTYPECPLSADILPQ